jgi:uncharacterized protein with HEPN domain
MSKGKHTAEHLQDMLDYLDKAATFTRNGRSAFDADEMAQLAVIRVYEGVGEIAKRLPAELRDRNPQIDWRTLAGLRDFLSHNDDEILLSFIWQVIEDLPALRAKVQAILDSLSHDADE